MRKREWRPWYGLESIKSAWDGDQVDGQAEDLLYNDAVYGDNVNMMLSHEVYEFARADGYVIDGWHEVPLEDVVKRHEQELLAILEQEKPSVTKESNIDFYNYLVHGIFTFDGEEI